jgi:hypothetical protein
MIFPRMTWSKLIAVLPTVLMSVLNTLGWMFCFISLIGVVDFSVPKSAAATVLHTADAANAIVVQSRRTIRDQQRQSWQVIAFKSVRPDMQDLPLTLRVVGFPGGPALAHPEPGQLIDLQHRVWPLPDRSAQVAVDPALSFSLGQYDLAAVLGHLPTAQRLQLQLPTADAANPIVLPIPPALIHEWQTVAAVAASDLVNQCDLFPMEARQNPKFPLWTGCRLAEP